MGLVLGLGFILKYKFLSVLPHDPQRVAQLCNQTELLGNKPSVRKIIAELGGSFTVVAEYLKQWREEKELAKESDMAISQELQQAILAEYALVAIRLN